MNLVITGAGGFLGKNLIEYFSKCKDKPQITAITSNVESLLEKYKKNYKTICVVDKDNLDMVDWKQADVLLNCAFPRNNDDVQMAKGLKFISKVITIAKDRGTRAVINISSQSVYSQTREQPATEDTELSLETKYAVGKYATELITNSVCRDIPHTNLRLASLVGIGFEQRIINKLVNKTLRGEKLNIIGGQQKFGFLNVVDATYGLNAIIYSNPQNWEEVYNLGTNEICTLKEIADIILEKSEQYLGEKNQVFYEEADMKQNSSMICDKFSSTFSWEPVINLQRTIDMIFQAYIRKDDGSTKCC